VAVLDSPEFRASAALGLAYALAGRRAEALDVVRGLTKPGSNPDSLGLARIYLVLGDKDRGDPLFQALVARLNIPN
jgi:hypothetical protein